MQKANSPQHSPAVGGVLGTIGGSVPAQPWTGQRRAPELVQANPVFDSLGGLELLALLGELQAATAAMAAPGLKGLERLELIAKAIEANERAALALGLDPASQAAPAPQELTDETGAKYRLMTDAQILYRAMSPEEWAAVADSGKITGGANTFNGSDGRRLVFFADKLDANLLHQGKDSSRRVAYQLKKEGIDKPLADAMAFAQELRAKHDAEPNPAQQVAIVRQIRNADKIIESLQKGVDEQLRSKSAALTEADAQRGYSYVVVKTKPVTGGRIYTGKDSLYPGAEYGFEAGQLGTADIDSVTYMDGDHVQAEHNTPEDLEAAISDAGAGAAVAALLIEEQAAIRMLQALASKPLPTDPTPADLSTMATEMKLAWSQAYVAREDLNQGEAEVPAPLLAAAKNCFAQFLKLESATYANI